MDRLKLQELADRIDFVAPASLGVEAMGHLPCLLPLDDPIASAARRMEIPEDKVREALAALQAWIGELLDATLPLPPVGQVRYTYANGYGAAIWPEAEQDGRYSVSVLGPDGDVAYDTTGPNGIYQYLYRPGVAELLHRIEALPNANR